MQRGSSGATFTYLGDRVVKKQDSDRVMAQGMWLQRHRSSAVPYVFQTYAKSYVMERLTTAPNWALDHQMIFNHMMATLNQHVWSQPAEVVWDSDATFGKIIRLCTEYSTFGIELELKNIFDSVDWSQLRRCLTHGDPTFDNVMFRESTGEIVLTDPIPASAAIPDLMSVDLGKILQSMLGWERVRYGYRHAFTVAPLILRNRIMDEGEWTATVFWAIVHLLRAFPYVTDDVRDKLKERIHAAFRLLL